jgi:hypothetical protein
MNVKISGLLVRPLGFIRLVETASWRIWSSFSCEILSANSVYNIVILLACIVCRLWFINTAISKIPMGVCLGNCPLFLHQFAFVRHSIIWTGWYLYKQYETFRAQSFMSLVSCWYTVLAMLCHWAVVTYKAASNHMWFHWSSLNSCIC